MNRDVKHHDLHQLSEIFGQLMEVGKYLGATLLI